MEVLPSIYGDNPFEGSYHQSLTVDRHGLALDNLYFDFTNDFARCLSYIEDAIFCAERKMKVTDNNYHGITVKFNA